MLTYPHPYKPNDPAFKGRLAGPKMLFGEYSRYAVAPVHTRFEAVEWFVWDAATDYGTGPEVIRQAPTFYQAVMDLEPPAAGADFTGWIEGD